MSHRIPIQQDNLSFEERQSKVWTDMEKDMERRRKEWEDEIEHMRKDFFHLKPDDGKLEAIPDRLGLQGAMHDDAKGSIERDQHGRSVFRARFNVKDYKPEEVNVKVDNDKLIVTAKHEEKGGNKTVSREFSREINIPREADQMSMGCTISSDGILTAEAPITSPGYQQITAAPSGPRERIIPTVTPLAASSQVLPPPPPPAGSSPAPATHTSTFTTFMSPKGAVPVPPYTSPASSVSTSTVQQTFSSPVQQSFSPPIQQSFSPPIQQSFSPQQSFSSSSATSKFETRSGSGSPATVDRDRKYKVEVDIEDFAPEDINVRTVDKTLVISARREERIGSRSSTKELNREFSLPDTVDPMAVKAFFADSGKLLIEAPYLKPVAVGHYADGREGSPITGR